MTGRKLRLPGRFASFAWSFHFACLVVSLRLPGVRFATLLGYATELLGYATELLGQQPDCSPMQPAPGPKLHLRLLSRLGLFFCIFSYNDVKMMLGRHKSFFHP
jgi:hypothetical protein